MARALLAWQPLRRGERPARTLVQWREWMSRVRPTRAEGLGEGVARLERACYGPGAGVEELRALREELFGIVAQL